MRHNIKFPRKLKKALKASLMKRIQGWKAKEVQVTGYRITLTGQKIVNSCRLGWNKSC